MGSEEGAGSRAAGEWERVAAGRVVADGRDNRGAEGREGRGRHWPWRVGRDAWGLGASGNINLRSFRL
jgi:hypothetical protein